MCIETELFFSCFLLDDLSLEIYKSPFVEQMFIQHSHHNKASIVFTSQNYFNSGRKTIIRNCNYRVFFQDPTDDVTLRNVSSQLK